MTTATGALRRARALIESPNHWCKGVERGKSCALHALGYANGPTTDALYEAARRRGFNDPVDFNDAPGTQHADVLALFDEAIAIAEGI